MSKMDGLRAMREARYAETMARATQPPASKATPEVAPDGAPAEPVRKAPAKARTRPAAAKVEVPEEQRCGHRAISGRTCTREQGHAAKSHRYA